MPKRGEDLKRSVREREAEERKQRAAYIWRRRRTATLRRAWKRSKTRAALTRLRKSLSLQRFSRERTMGLHKKSVVARKRLENFRQALARKRRPLRLRALHVAETLVGVMEQGGNNAGPMVTRIIRENGGVGPEPWCGDFVAYCYRHGGSKSVQRGWASTLLLGFLAGMQRISSPKAGDIVVFDFPGGQSSDHTGLFVKFVAGGIEAIEGNTGASGAVSDSATGGDGVYRKRRSHSQVARYVRVLR